MPWTDENGIVRPGPSPQQRRRRVIITVTITVGLSVTLAFGPAGLGAGGDAAPGLTVSENASVDIRTARTDEQKKDRTTARLPRHQGDVKADVEHDNQPCASHATGEVKRYLTQHPCRNLQRGSFTFAPYGSDSVVLSVAWIEMPTASEASDLKHLVDAPGAGHIEPLDSDAVLTGQHYKSSISGPLVTTAEAEPKTVSVPAQVLKVVADQGAS